MSEYQLNPGKVYKFEFDALIETINGVYRLMNLMTLDDIIDTDIDLFKHTYEPLNIIEADYITTVQNHLQEALILKLQSVTDTTKIYFIPIFLLVNQPVVNINPYLRLGLAVNLGIFNDSTRLEWIKNEIQAMLQAKAGIVKEAAIFATDETWLTESEYQAIETTRQNLINNTTSIYKANEDLTNTISNLQALIADYEALIVSAQP